MYGCWSWAVSCRFFTFGEKEQADDLNKVFEMLSEEGVNVGQLWNIAYGFFRSHFKFKTQMKLLLTFKSPKKTFKEYLFDKLSIEYTPPPVKVKK
jgi:hypothetical protein